MDYLGIALAELAAISERRVFRLTDSSLNAGLPAMLVDSPEQAGLHSGVMMLQYTAASLVLENRTLSTPDSTNSLPTSAEKEDHNANAMTAARHVRQIIANTCQVLAIETYTAVRALEIRLREQPEGQLGRGTAAAFTAVREAAPYQAGDIWWQPEVDKVSQLIRSRKLIDRVHQALTHE
jgi:histidine ammonia-lyase